MTGPKTDEIQRGDPRPPLFLARRSYRRRRMMDACRMLPVLGAALWMVPILWQPAVTPERDTAPGIVYLFGIWALLVLVSGILSRGLTRALEDGEGEGG